MGGGIEKSGRGERGRTSVVGSSVNAVEWEVGKVKYAVIRVRGI